MKLGATNSFVPGIRVIHVLVNSRFANKFTIPTVISGKRNFCDQFYLSMM
jgi:hypothetical protein